MTVAARIARHNAAVQRHWGETVTYTDALAATTTCTAVIRSEYDELGLFGAQSSVRERRWSALIDASDVADPQPGDTLTTSTGAVFRVDADPTDESGQWRLVLKQE